jgi:hypothetical protein
VSRKEGDHRSTVQKSKPSHIVALHLGSPLFSSSSSSSSSIPLRSHFFLNIFLYILSFIRSFIFRVPYSWRTPRLSLDIRRQCKARATLADNGKKMLLE